MSTQILTELPRIQKTGMDFDSVMTEIRNIVNENPNWKENWNEFYDSEAGTMLCSLMAWIADNMTSRQDLLYNEMFIGTAQDDENKIKHLKQIGYIPKMAHASKVPIRIVLSNVTNGKIHLTPEFKSGDDFSSRPSKIASFSGKDINGRTINWEVLPFIDGKPDYKGGVTLSSQEIEYTKNEKNEILYAAQGKTIYEEFVIPTNDGSYFDLREKNIASDSIQVYRKDTGELLKEARSFLTIINDNKNKDKLESPYIIELNNDRSFRIKFAGKEFFDEKKLLKAGTVISVFYRTCEGSLGNIKSNYISQSTNLINENGDAISANIYNDLPAVEGSDMESLDNAVKNGPTTLITMDRAVTPDDYDIVLNNNTNIFKTKTYTASNQPNEGKDKKGKTFKDYYGRYINPQESFIFTLLNKQHEGVPTEQYNYFPWITTNKEPRLNEKYIFNSGNFNRETSYSSISYNSKLIINGDNQMNFNNSTLIKLGNDFNDFVKPDNPFLEVRLTSEKTKEIRLNKVNFDILGNNKYISLRIPDEKNKSNEIESLDNARFVTKDSVDNKIPINIKNFEKLTFVLNNEAQFDIDLSVAFENDYENLKEAYLYWNNEPTATAITNDGSKEAAITRKGIVQIINDSVNGAISAEGKYKYLNEYSRQGFGLSFNNETNESKLSKNSTFYLSIGENKYEFAPPAVMAALSEKYTYKGVVDLLNGCFKGTLLYSIKKYSDGSYTEIDAADQEELKKYSAIIYDKKFEELSTNSISSISLSNYDIAIVKKMALEETIKIKDGDVNNGLIKILKSDSSLPDPLPSISYKDIAKFIKEEYESEGTEMGRFCVQTNNKGEQAKLFFIKKENDFGENFLKIPYFKETGYSPEVSGIRKAILLIEDPISYNGSASLAAKGNIIFQNSCMFNDYDFKNIYAHYKLENIDRLKIGSTYNNYYYSGNEKADQVVKDTKIYGILGQVVDTVLTENGTKRVLNMDKSNFNIKLTKEPQETNSLFAIKDDFDAIPSDYVQIVTKELNNLSGEINLEIDGESIIANILNATNGIELKKQFKNAVSNNKKILNNFDHIFSVPYDNINRLIIRSISKQKGYIKFSFEENNNDVYKNLFGSKDDNSDMYTLYEGLYNEDGYLYPTKEKPLVFKYRTFKNKVSREADYYIDAQPVGDEENGEYNYYINKTPNSTFPDNFFYMHFINDKTSSKVETDESVLQSYMDKKTVSGTETIFLQPYFSTYDISMDVSYNSSFNKTEIKNNIIKSINDLCGLKNAQIAGSMSIAKIFKEVMNINGVMNCRINYFGYNINDPEKKTQEVIKSNFYEISCLHETDNDGRGLTINLSHL